MTFCGVGLSENSKHYKKHYNTDCVSVDMFYGRKKLFGFHVTVTVTVRRQCIGSWASLFDPLLSVGFELPSDSPWNSQPHSFPQYFPDICNIHWTSSCSRYLGWTDAERLSDSFEEYSSWIRFGSLVFVNASVLDYLCHKFCEASLCKKTIHGF